MNHIPTVSVTTGTLRAPDAELYFEVRGSGPLVVLTGAPMDAAAFAPLADMLAADHTVLTTDPRGINRSRVDDRDRDSTPEDRAGDLVRLIRYVDAGPATVFGSSGGAVSALAMTQAYPELVHTVIAHEPPLYNVVNDGAELRAKCEDYIATYFAGDVVGSWRKFMAMADIDMPEPVLQHIFGGERSPQQVADDDFQNGKMLRPTTRWRPDIAALRAASTRVVIGIGEGSADQLCDRTSRALAARLQLEPSLFPGGHIGFTEAPDRFANTLRVVIGGMTD